MFFAIFLLLSLSCSIGEICCTNNVGQSDEEVYYAGNSTKVSGLTKHLCLSDLVTLASEPVEMK